uniref:UPAR/Ly6 domain-containing protein n=1 Tax=Cyprinodon variegatus TaxID=28743 RepID=A0A3Q2DVN5_CYPVA
MFNWGSKHSIYKAKTCVLSRQCLNGSATTGSSKVVVTSVCCKSNLCNSQDFPEPAEFSSNGKKCFKCVGSDCTGSVNCEGNEDYCFISKCGSPGCASKLICSENSVNWFPLTFQANISCCQGDYCNGAGIISGDLMLLFMPLSFLLFCY